MDQGSHCIVANMTKEQLQAIIHGIPEGVALFAGNAELTVLYANEAFYRIFGYTREDLSGKSGMAVLELLVLPEDYQRFTEQIDGCGESENRPEFRIRSKNGEHRWIRLSVLAVPKVLSGAVCCFFFDITKEKNVQRELQIQQERYRTVTEQLNDVFFEYDFAADTMTASSGWEKIFGYPLKGENVLFNIFSGDYVYEDDKEIISQIFERANHGIATSELELRVRKAGGGYIWVSVSTNILCGDDGNPIKVVGKISNIDDRKREREKLISNAQREPLTGLYNKIAVESYIRSCLRVSDESMRHALMIIDVDNFKRINDTLGHLFGDAVLTEISSKLRALFRSSDIIGRFGGDEFIVFLKNIGSVQQIAQKAGTVCDIFRETYTGVNKDYKISGSVGVSIYPEHGSNFYDLFQQADTALYQAKQRGKDGFVIYGRTGLDQTGKLQSTVQPASAGRIHIRAPQSIVTDICTMLVEAKNAGGAFEMVLRMLGHEFLAGRVFIFEQGKGSYRKTFEWYAENKKPMITPSPYGDFSFALCRFQEDGYYYCPDLSLEEMETEMHHALKSSGVRTFFLYPLFLANRLVGVIGLEGAFPWPIEERRILTDLCKIIGLYIIKYRKNEKIQQELNYLHRVQERLGLCLYVVKPDSWELKYVNPSLKAAAPGAKEGELCYRALKGRNSVCENCPAILMDGRCRSFHDEPQKSWADSFVIPMENDEACVLIGCSDSAGFAGSGCGNTTGEEHC
ncbi:MAG TPA: diguanylate cyclase [Clostridiales bacterium]|nr:diguanylate cyclase [Clostridiales bacterium]